MSDKTTTFVHWGGYAAGFAGAIWALWPKLMKIRSDLKEGKRSDFKSLNEQVKLLINERYEQTKREGVILARALAAEKEVERLTRIVGELDEKLAKQRADIFEMQKQIGKLLIGKQP